MKKLRQLADEFELDQRESRSQSPRSFWSAPSIETSDRVQYRKSAIHGFIVKCDKSDWLKIQNEYSALAQKIGSRQRSRCLVLTKRIVGSGNENVVRSARKSNQTASHVFPRTRLSRTNNPRLRVVPNFGDSGEIHAHVRKRSPFSPFFARACVYFAGIAKILETSRSLERSRLARTLVAVTGFYSILSNPGSNVEFSR